MENRILRITAMGLALAVSAESPAVLAQSSAATREGNVWGWRDHQPTQTRTLQDEKAAGIAPNQSQLDTNAAAEDQLFRQLMHRSPD
jgi:hypothetical protein